MFQLAPVEAVTCFINLPECEKHLETTLLLQNAIFKSLSTPYLYFLTRNLSIIGNQARQLTTVAILIRFGRENIKSGRRRAAHSFSAAHAGG